MNETTFFVSPNGNDSGSGSFDGPFATVARARKTVKLCRGAPL